MTITNIKPRRPPARVLSGGIRSELRAVDGARSPFFAALKRRADLREEGSTYRVELGEQRQIVIPWLRWPIFVYWRRRIVRGQKLERIEIVVRTFLETGHVPAQWWV